MEPKKVEVAPIIPQLLLHHPLVWEQGHRAPSAASASVGWFPRSSQAPRTKTYSASNSITGPRKLALSRISREEQEVKSARKRFRQSGAKDDPWDARLIADLLRTDQERYTAWKPDRPLTRRIRTQVGLACQRGRDLVRDGNRLRSILMHYYPAVLEAFPHLDSVVFLAYLQANSTPKQAQALSYEDLPGFFAHASSHPNLLLANHLRWPACGSPQAYPELEAACSPLALAQARIFEMLVRSRSERLTWLGKLEMQNPDREIYDSLPKAGAHLAPALLAKFGDDRARYPNPAVLQAVAGTCPVTNRSGKHFRVHFRAACGHEFRHIAQQWARLSLGASPWAATYFRTVRPHCKRIVMRSAAWPTAGLKFCGDYGSIKTLG